MQAVVRVRKLKLAFVYTQTVSGLQTNPPLQNAPAAFLATRAGTIEHYEQVRSRMDALAKQIGPNDPHKAERRRRQQELSSSGDLLPPWPWLFLSDTYIHYFWKFYLASEPNETPGERLWQHVTPFQLALPVNIKPAEPQQWLKPLNAVLYVYPHGVAIIIQATLSFSDEYLSNVISDVIAVRSGLTYDVTINGQPSSGLKIEVIAKRLLDAARVATFGGESTGSSMDPIPLSVATIVQASGVDQNAHILPNGQLHQALEALCDHKRGAGWNNQDTIEGLKHLGAADLLVNQATPPTDVRRAVVYHLVRGRAVWMPKYLQPTPVSLPQHSLSCYHRNLTLVFMQTEMLRRAIALFLNNKEQASGELHDFAQQAGIQLRQLYGLLKNDDGEKLTYNSSTPRAYLDEGGYRDRINAGLRELGLKELEVPKPKAL